MASSSCVSAGAVPVTVRGVLKKNGCGTEASTAASPVAIDEVTETPTANAPASLTLTPPPASTLWRVLFELTMEALSRYTGLVAVVSKAIDDSSTPASTLIRTRSRSACADAVAALPSASSSTNGATALRDVRISSPRPRSTHRGRRCTARC